MTRILRVSSLAALIVASAAPAFAASPAGYCSFTSPASFTCSADERKAEVAPAQRVAVADHCIVTSPASTACPANDSSVAVANTAAPSGQGYEVSRK